MAEYKNKDLPTGLYWQGKRTEVERISSKKLRKIASSMNRYDSEENYRQ
jgi:hypothetical protein